MFIRVIPGNRRCKLWLNKNETASKKSNYYKPFLCKKPGFIF
jgi:hypothetical protein